jgi:hypothetical protein
MQRFHRRISSKMLLICHVLPVEGIHKLLKASLVRQAQIMMFRKLQRRSLSTSVIADVDRWRLERRLPTWTGIGKTEPACVGSHMR